MSLAKNGAPKSPFLNTTLLVSENDAAADRRHPLDPDHSRTVRACAGGHAAVAVAMVAR